MAHSYVVTLDIETNSDASAADIKAAVMAMLNAGLEAMTETDEEMDLPAADLRAIAVASDLHIGGALVAKVHHADMVLPD